MKAQTFFELVRKMMTAQQDYFESKRNGASKQEQTDLLVASKKFEKQVWAVIAEGRLEPDEPTATVQVFTTEAFQEELRMINEAELRKQLELDFPSSQRPTEPMKGDQSNEEK